MSKKPKTYKTLTDLYFAILKGKLPRDEVLLRIDNDCIHAYLEDEDAVADEQGYLPDPECIGTFGGPQEVIEEVLTLLGLNAEGV